jgi:hypothetical protein
MDKQTKESLATQLFAELITRAEELRGGDPDKYRDWDSKIASGQVRSVLMAMCELLMGFVLQRPGDYMPAADALFQAQEYMIRDDLTIENISREIEVEE